MAVTEREREVVQGVFDAMQAGPSGEEKMLSLFADDAELVEPFGGAPQAHVGKDAIRQHFRSIWEQPGPHDLSLAIDQIDAQDGEVQVLWTCTSASFKSPMKGADRFVIEGGLIKKLHMEVTTWPEMNG